MIHKGIPSPVPSWVVDEIAHSQVSYPEEWIQYTGTRSRSKQFKFVTGGKDINDPFTYEPGYSAILYNAVRPGGGALGYENIAPSFKERNFTLKVTNQFVQNMGNVRLDIYTSFYNSDFGF